MILFFISFQWSFSAQKNSDYSLNLLYDDIKSENFYRIISENSFIIDSIISKHSNENYIDLVYILYIINTKEYQFSNALEYAKLFLSYFEKENLKYGQYYLNGLKYCAETASIIDSNELVIKYSTLGIDFIESNNFLDKSELIFFLELNANSKFYLGKYNEAIMSYRKLLFAYDEYSYQDIMVVSKCRFNLATSYFYLGIFDKAEKLFNEIIDINNQYIDDLTRLICKFYIYKCLVLTNKHDEALDYYFNLKPEIDKTPDFKSNFQWDFCTVNLINYCGLGELCLKSNNPDSVLLAKNYLNKALHLGRKLEKKIENKYFSQQTNEVIYQTISLVHYWMNNIELSQKYAELSHNNAVKTICFIAENKQREADSVFLELLRDINKTFHSKAQLGIDENLILKRQLVPFNIMALMNYINIRDSEDASPANDKMVNFAFENWINFNGNLKINNYLSEEKINEIKNLKAQKNKIIEGALTPSMIKMVSSLNDSIAILESMLLNELNSFEIKISFENIQRLLNKGEVYVDLIEVKNFDFKRPKIQDGHFYQVFILKGEMDTSLYYFSIPSVDSKSLDFKNQNDLKYLYNELWEPIAEKIGDAKTVYISLGGIYNNFNLNTLYNPETEKYLLEEKDIRIVNCARDFALSKESEKKNYISNTASLFGFPDFDGNNTVSTDSSNLIVSQRDFNTFWLDSITRGGMEARPLPETKTEIENISSTFKSNNWQVSFYLEENASETNFKNQENPRVLHVATHGYFLEDVPIENQDQNRLLGVDKEVFSQDPMLRSGLLFSGANKTLNGEIPLAENGLLSAAEASLLDLRETELVVLSACETGRGEIKNSEGVYGLRKAFADAGAQNIIMSLWKVDDKVTQEFMTRFYEIWLNERTTIREAFNRTQLEIKAKYPQPYYWGAFILVGE